MLFGWGRKRPGINGFPKGMSTWILTNFFHAPFGSLARSISITSPNLDPIFLRLSLVFHKAGRPWTWTQKVNEEISTSCQVTYGLQVLSIRWPPLQDQGCL